MLVDFFVPAIVVLLMTLVGIGLMPAQFIAVLRAPVALLGGTLLQYLLLPLGAAAMILLLQPPFELAGGLLLVAASPGGALSNYYCHLGRLNVAFSVMLTALSGIAAFAMMPLLLTTVAPVVLGVQAFAIPFGELALRLLLFLMLPVGVGMLLRHFLPGLMTRHVGVFHVTGLVLLVVLLAFIVFDQREAIPAIVLDTAVLTASFTGLAVLAGWSSGWMLRVDPGDRAVLAVEFAVRNVGIAAVLALTTFRRPEFAAFGALFVLFQFPLVALMLLCHRTAHRRPR
jgi:bile acid:Na+ symporter, BASS family